MIIKTPFLVEVGFCFFNDRLDITASGELALTQILERYL